MIASGAASTPEDVSNYAGCTLLAAGLTSDPSVNANQEDKSSTATAIQKCTKFLQEQEFVILQKVPAGGKLFLVFKTLVSMFCFLIWKPSFSCIQQ